MELNKYIYLKIQLQEYTYHICFETNRGNAFIVFSSNPKLHLKL